MAACSAFGCTNRHSKQIPGIAYHRFPTNPDLKEKWIMAIRRKNWLPSKHSRICSAHFADDVICRSLKRIRLQDNAVPSIFPAFPSYYQMKPVRKIKVSTTKAGTVSEENKKITKIDKVTTSSSMDKLGQNCIDISSTSSCDTNDSDSLSSEKILKRKLEIMTALYEKSQKKLKLCQEQCKLYVKQVIALEEVIDNLRQINSVSDIN